MIASPRLLLPPLALEDGGSRCSAVPVPGPRGRPGCRGRHRARVCRVTRARPRPWWAPLCSLSSAPRVCAHGCSRSLRSCRCEGSEKAAGSGAGVRLIVGFPPGLVHTRYFGIRDSDRISSAEGERDDVLTLQPHTMLNAAELISAAVTFCYPERQKLGAFLRVQPPAAGGTRQGLLCPARACRVRLCRAAPPLKQLCPCSPAPGALSSAPALLGRGLAPKTRMFLVILGAGNM